MPVLPCETRYCLISLALLFTLSINLIWLLIWIYYEILIFNLNRLLAIYLTKRGEPFRDKTCIRGEIRRYLILNSDPDEYPPIGTSLGHFREHGNGRAMFRLQYPQHSYLSDLTGKPRMRKKVFFLQCIRFNLVYIYSAWTSGSTQ